MKGLASVFSGSAGISLAACQPDCDAPPLNAAYHDAHSHTATTER